MSIHGAVYHFDDLAEAEAAGVYTPADPNDEAAKGEWHSFVNLVDRQGWLKEPVPDPDNAERLLEEGIPPKPIMIIAPEPLPALAAYRIYPIGVAGLSGVTMQSAS